jgi:hypothetical protein
MNFWTDKTTPCIFNQLLYKSGGKPEIPGISPSDNITAYAFFEYDQATKKYNLDAGVNVDIMERVLPVVYEKKGTESFFTLNIEHWDMSGDFSRVATGLANLSLALRTANRLLQTTLVRTDKLGFYRLLPTRELYIVDQKYLTRWQRRNDVVMTFLGDHLGYLAPSLYLFAGYANHQEYLETQIKEAKRIAGDRPVCCYLWPRYHTSGTHPQAGKVIDYTTFRIAMQICLDAGCHVVVWEYADRWEVKEAYKAIADQCAALAVS